MYYTQLSFQKGFQKIIYIHAFFIVFFDLKETVDTFKIPAPALTWI